MEEAREAAADAQWDGVVTEVDGEKGARMVMYRRLECWLQAENQSYVRSGTKLQSHSSWAHLHSWMAWQSQARDQ